MFRKGVFPYEYMDNWQKVNETTLAEIEEFYSNLNIKDITDADYMHEKRVCKDFELKNLDEYYDLYLKSDTLFLADVFENFRNMCTKVYELDPANFFSAPGLAWQAAFKMTEVKLALLTDIDMLLMVGKGIGGGICHAIHRYAKANNKYMKDFDKNKETLHLKYWGVNNLHGWTMSQKLLVRIFEWIEGNSPSNEDFKKSYDEEVDEGYFLQVGVQYPEKLHQLHNNLSFLPERMKLGKIEKFLPNLRDKTDYIIHIL